MRLILDYMTEAVLIIQDEHVKYCNLSALKLLNLADPSTSEATFYEQVHPQDRTELLQRHTSVLSQQMPRGAGTFRLHRPDDGYRQMQSLEIAFAWQGQPALLALLNDVSSLNELELQLRQAEKMRTLGTLVAGVAHEINNPINLAMYNISILEKIWHDFLPVLAADAQKHPQRKYGGLRFDYLKANLKQLLDDTDLAVHRVADIVRDLKNYSRLSDVSEVRIMQVNKAVENALRLGRAAIKKFGVVVETRLEPDLPMMEGNPQSIEQVILNLIINAAQATEQGRGQVTITTGFQNQGGQLFIEVADNGHGIDPNIEENIFQPFVTTKQQQGGTGLGLSVTYTMVRGHGGQIRAANRRGGGSRFTVTLPALVRPLKFLITDDDQTFRSLFEQVLSNHYPCEIEHAANGVQACINLGSFMPDILVLDMFMPEMDGLEVCRSIKRTPALASVKVLITTGFPDHPKIQKAQDMGFGVIHNKATGLRGFLEALDQVLSQ